MSENNKEKYIGSVRFFKHLILGTIGILILVPTAASFVLGANSIRLRSENQEIRTKLESAEEEMAFLQQSEAAEVQSTHSESTISMLEGNANEDWKLILVNEYHPLEAGFEVELKTVTGGQKVDARIVEPLMAMMQQMREEGLWPTVCSGYRTIEKQSRLFNEYIEGKQKNGWKFEDAFFKAKTRIAVPGTSEHHTGLAIDIVGMSHQSLDDAQAETKEAMWLAQHCAEYGFILRYPKDKTDITGIDYESWHFRYVGEEAAASIMKQGITLEEYLEAVDK